MIVRCDSIENIKVCHDGCRDIVVSLKNIYYFGLYMDNDMTKILDEIPTEELKAYLKQRVENDNR